MQTKRINFTEKAIAAIQAPSEQEKKITYYDDGSNDGLILVTTYGGAKTYYFYMKFKGRPIQKKIGRACDMKVVEARAKAHELREMANQGDDPTGGGKEDYLKMTLKEFYDTQYRPRHALVHNKPKSVQKADTMIRNNLKKYHLTKMQDITRADVSKLHNDIMQNTSLFTANRVITLLSHMYKLACEWGDRKVYYNPVNGVKKFKEQSRERFLQPDELNRFFTALMEDPNEQFRNFILLALFLGQRRSNILSMRWENVMLADKENANVYFPTSKNGESQRIPLSEQAYELLKHMQEQNEGITKGWVFPSATYSDKRKSKSGHVEDYHRPWYALLKRANIEDLRIHDLRRTFGSYQAITGASPFILGKALGDKTDAAVRVYARLTMDPIRDSIQRGTNKMMDFFPEK